MANSNAVAARGTLTARPSASRKLLSAKATKLAGAAALPTSDALEDAFPAAPHTRPQSAAQPATPAPGELVATELAPELAWSAEDERTFQAMAARRKAAGYQRRGRDVAGQLLRVGAIAPNTGTVVATIVAVVAEHGEIRRDALVAAMAAATFPHPRARPADHGWCQGYVAGAVRDGFLVLVEAAPVGGTLGAPGTVEGAGQ